MLSKDFLGKEVKVIIDRPLGSYHQEYKDIFYSVNYGFIPDTMADDGEEIDVYILDVDYPIKECKAKIIAFLHRLDDNEDKLIGVCNNTKLTDEEILRKIDFIEKYFKSKLIR